jgi:MFS family permease
VEQYLDRHAVSVLRIKIKDFTDSVRTGPLFAGIIVTYQSWRLILWVQVAMIGFGLLLSLSFIPSSQLDPKEVKLGLPSRATIAKFNPLPVFKIMTYPNVGLTVCVC